MEVLHGLLHERAAVGVGRDQLALADVDLGDLAQVHALARDHRDQLRGVERTGAEQPDREGDLVRERRAVLPREALDRAEPADLARGSHERDPLHALRALLVQHRERLGLVVHAAGAGADLLGRGREDRACPRTRRASASGSRRRSRRAPSTSRAAP